MSFVLTLAPLILLAACSIYDEKLIDWDTSSSGNNGGEAGGGGTSPGTAGTGGSAGADVGDNLTDGGELLEDGCVPEICDGEDNDCDGELSNGCERDLNDGPCAAVFPYSPSNFDPALLERASAPAVTLDCAAVYDSSDPSGFDQWCGQPAPSVSVSTAADPPVAILTLLSFTVTGTGSLTIVGDKPVILAVFGSAAIDGVIDASASGTTPGAGGDRSCTDSAGAAGQTGLLAVENAGGGGGGFGTAGGRGGNSNLTIGGSGGIPRGNAALVPLMAGCPGGAAAAEPLPLAARARAAEPCKSRRADRSPSREPSAPTAVRELTAAPSTPAAGAAEAAAPSCGRARRSLSPVRPSPPMAEAAVTGG